MRLEYLLLLTPRGRQLLLVFVQAVRETAISRAALFGTTTAVPNLLVLLLQRSVTFNRTHTFMFSQYVFFFIALVLSVCFFTLGKPLNLVMYCSTMEMKFI